MGENRPVAPVSGASGGIAYELAKMLRENGLHLIVAATERQATLARPHQAERIGAASALRFQAIRAATLCIRCLMSVGLATSS